jgi:hypothetical protein
MHPSVSQADGAAPAVPTASPARKNGIAAAINHRIHRREGGCQWICQLQVGVRQGSALESATRPPVLEEACDDLEKFHLLA